MKHQADTGMVLPSRHLLTYEAAHRMLGRKLLKRREGISEVSPCIVFSTCECTSRWPKYLCLAAGFPGKGCRLLVLESVQSLIGLQGLATSPFPLPCRRKADNSLGLDKSSIASRIFIHHY